MTEWQRFLMETFGSREWLWDAPDELRFDRAGRELVGAGFRLPYEAADAEDSARLPATPPPARAAFALTKPGNSAWR